jgi:hypothetical protein
VASDKIKVTCHGCGARYQVRASKVRGHRFRATCKKCGGIIVAHCSNAFTVLPDRGTGDRKRPSQRSPMQLSHDELRTFQEEDDPTWYVVIGGKPHGPMSTMQLRASFESARVSERTYLWRAGDPEWRRLGEVPEFMDLVADSEHTGYYDSHSEEETGETRAAGPKGIRKQAGVISDGTPDLGPEGDNTTFYQANPEAEISDSEAQATKFHFRPEGEAGGPVPEPGQGMWNQQQQPSWQMPVIPPRKAILPSPTGAPRAPTQSSMPAEPAAPGPSPEFTRPLSDSAKANAVRSDRATSPGELGMLPSLAPSLPPQPMPKQDDLPPPPESVFSQSLKPVGPPAGPALLAPAEEPFWTTGKIAAAAAIGGGLAVAMAVVVVVSLVRPKPKPVVVGGVTQAKVKKEGDTPPKVKTTPPEEKETPPPPEEKKAETAPPEPAAQAAKVKTPVPAKPAKTEPPPRKEPKAAKARKSRKSRATRVSLRKKPKRRKKKSRQKRPKPRRARATEKKGLHTEIDDLLDGAAKGKDSKEPRSNVDPDALLAAGTGKKKKKKSGGPNPDDLLNVGTKPKAKPQKTRPSQAEIQAAMRKVVPRVRGCFDKYKIAGRADVTITLRPNGTFDARVVGQFAGTPTGYCVLAGVNKARFPTFSGANPIRFTYPFHLK